MAAIRAHENDGVAARCNAFPSRRRASRFAVAACGPTSGFTLIELLVVVVIIGVLAAALVLSVGASGDRQLANTSERFQALVGFACGQAELTGREIGAVLDADGYAFRRLEGSAWREFGGEGELRPRKWPGGLRIELERAGRPLDLATPGHDAPQIVCFSSGELTPFLLSLGLGESPLRYRTVGADDGTLKTDRVEAAP